MFPFLFVSAEDQDNEEKCTQYPAPRLPLEGTSGIPAIGLGMCCRPSAHGKMAEDAVVDYLKIGGRHIDTAHVYGNHVDIGKGIKKSGIQREHIFLTSKVWFTHFGRQEALKAVEKYLEELQTPYLDLLLIHIPGVTKGLFEDDPLPACIEQKNGEKDWKKCRLETWAALEELKKMGKAKAIGVSNFNPRHMREIKEAPDNKFPIQLNQIEVHPFFHNKETVDYCQAHNITVTAYAPLGSHKNVTEFLTNDKVKGMDVITKKYGKSASQVLLRYPIEQGFVTIPGTSKRAHMEENQNIFDFKLDADDMRILSSVPESKQKATFPHLPDTIL